MLPRDSFYRDCPTYLNWNHFLELKRRWKVSLAALVRRGRDLGRISEASYKRAFVQLNRLGYRKNEPEEPAPELPQIIAKAIVIASEELPPEKIASDAGMTTSTFSEIVQLLGGEDWVNPI